MDDIVQRNERTRDNAKLRYAQAQMRQAEYILKNNQDLRKRNVISERQLFESEIARDLAEANQAAADIQAYAADLTVKEMKIYAPFDGIMGRPLVHEGTSINKEARPDTTLATITQLDPIQVISQVPYDIYASRREILKSDAQADQRLEFSLLLPDGSTFPHKGRLVAGGYAFDPKTQQIEIVVEFPNPNYLLRPGLMVTLQTNIEVGANAKQ
jgi:RND family efflux transporter MFP subunit